MKTIELYFINGLLTALLLLSQVSSYTDNSSLKVSKHDSKKFVPSFFSYKTFNTNDFGADVPLEEKIAKSAFNNFQRDFIANSNVLLLDGYVFANLDPGVSVNFEGENFVFSYRHGNIKMDVSSDQCYELEPVKFKKMEKTDLLKLEPTESAYVHEDGNFIIVIDANLDWKIQPALFASQMFPYGVSKVYDRKEKTLTKLINVENATSEQISKLELNDFNSTNCTKVKPFFL
ncbi:hypothetical protein [Winogradskyella sp. SYSU M77433]|uniref:hypothetical protein n=1 Tax=Winogradskyella sp. SYSU M77433 TaxID=3042722 RepID=UPI00248175FB|nr:hypothetical protein [Winogradskyella sp. SYSU M77433]MDH7913450.1 hypothetical protein [Winogradskyella sp. SYSU M77433]